MFVLPFVRKISMLFGVKILFKDIVGEKKIGVGHGMEANI